MTRAERAVALHAAGSSCAQAVLLAFAEEFGLDARTAHRLSGGLGAGLGRQQLTCGAITGASLVLGLAFGGGESEDQAAKERCYAAVHELVDRIKGERGAADCRSLLEGIDLTDPAGKAAFKERGMSAKVCDPLIERCVRLVEEAIAARPERAPDKSAEPIADFRLRRATAADAETVAEFRYRMFVDMHPQTDYRGIEAALKAGNVEYHRRRAADPDYYFLLAESSGRPIGCAGVVFEEKPPHARRLVNRLGYVLSVYVAPECRGRGVAKSLMRALHEEAARRGVSRLSLHASDLGRPLYLSLGYRPNPGYLELNT